MWEEKSCKGKVWKEGWYSGKVIKYWNKKGESLVTIDYGDGDIIDQSINDITLASISFAGEEIWRYADEFGDNFVANKEVLNLHVRTRKKKFENPTNSFFFWCARGDVPVPMGHKKIIGTHTKKMGTRQKKKKRGRPLFSRVPWDGGPLRGKTSFRSKTGNLNKPNNPRHSGLKNRNINSNFFHRQKAKKGEGSKT